jgi:hypothetical protein
VAVCHVTESAKAHAGLPPAKSALVLAVRLPAAIPRAVVGAALMVTLKMLEVRAI